MVDFTITPQTEQAAFTNAQAARILTHATFGPRTAEIIALGNISASQRFHQQTRVSPIPSRYKSSIHDILA